MLHLSGFVEPGRPAIGGEHNPFRGGASDDLSHKAPIKGPRDLGFKGASKML